MFMAEAATLAAKLKAEMRRAKVALEEARASVALAVRKNPTANGLDKVTDKTVDAAVSVAILVKAAKQKVLVTEEAADYMSSIVSALEHRRSMLRGEIDLHNSNYFGEVRNNGLTKAEKSRTQEGARQARKGK